MLEDMLRSCVLEFKGSWDEHLALIEFSYNNSYHSSIQMAPFEALYGRRCRSPVCWSDIGERRILGPEAVQKLEDSVRVIRAKLKTAQDRQKSYADTRRRPLEFAVGDQVFLRVSPSRGIQRFGVKGKLSPRFVGPFEIVARVDTVAYRLALPNSLAGVHDVFHVSQLRKYVSDPRHVLEPETVEIRSDLSYEELPVEILDRDERVLRRKTVRLVKVLWRNHEIEEATWELESEMERKYPHLFPPRYVSVSRTKLSFSRGECNDREN